MEQQDLTRAIRVGEILRDRLLAVKREAQMILQTADAAITDLERQGISTIGASEIDRDYLILYYAKEKAESIRTDAKYIKNLLLP
jgi:hypothetical protein